MRVMFFFFQAEDGIRDLVRSRGLGDVYKRQEVWGIQLTANWTTGFEYWVSAAGGRLISEDGKSLSLIHI